MPIHKERARVSLFAIMVETSCILWYKETCLAVKFLSTYPRHVDEVKTDKVCSVPLPLGSLYVNALLDYRLSEPSGRVSGFQNAAVKAAWSVRFVNPFWVRDLQYALIQATASEAPCCRKSRVPYMTSHNNGWHIWVISIATLTYRKPLNRL